MGGGVEEDPYERIERGFDLLADDYDCEIATNAIGVRMRRLFRTVLLEVVRPGDMVFEIGCGSGVDALSLAHRGLHVVATDISSRMVARVEEKAKAQGIGHLVRVQKCAAKDIGLLKIDYGEEAFDGGYCHAGALNMEPEIAAVPTQLRSLLKARAPFVCSVINRTSLFEVLFYLAVLKPRKAFRRLGGVIPIPISRSESLRHYVVPTRFYTPSEMARLFSMEFLVHSVRGMQVFLPPPNLADGYRIAGPVFSALEFVEDRLASKWPIRNWGQHSILTFRRR